MPTHGQADHDRRRRTPKRMKTFIVDTSRAVRTGTDIAERKGGRTPRGVRPSGDRIDLAESGRRAGRDHFLYEMPQPTARVSSIAGLSPLRTAFTASRR